MPQQRHGLDPSFGGSRDRPVMTHGVPQESQPKCSRCLYSSLPYALPTLLNERIKNMSEDVMLGKIGPLNLLVILWEKRLNSFSLPPYCDLSGGGFVNIAEC